MSLSIFPALPSELEEIHRLRISVTADEPIERFVFPNGASDISVAAYAEQDRQAMHNLNSPSRIMVVKDGETGELVSCANWIFFGLNGHGKDDEGGGEWPSDVNKEPLEALMVHGSQQRDEMMKGKPYAYLSDLSTWPSHRRRGAATMLIKWGLSLADAHHLPAFLEASFTGQHLYAKHGFTTVSTVTFDLNPWGVSYTETVNQMLRTAAPPLPPSNITISPWLTNADFRSFPAIEDQAFESSLLNELMCPLSPIIPSSTTTTTTTTTSSSTSFSSSSSSSFPPQSSTTSPSSSSSSSAQDDLTTRASAHLAFANSDPCTHTIKAFLPATGQIVAYGSWHIYPTPQSPHLHPAIHIPPHGNAALADHFFGTLLRAQERHMHGQAYLYMRLLVVLPAYQRQGLGSRLLRWGLTHADAMALPAWIDASPAGLGLYRTMGWSEVATFVIDLAEWGGRDGDREVTVMMLRQPKTGQSNTTSTSTSTNTSSEGQHPVRGVQEPLIC